MTKAVTSRDPGELLHRAQAAELRAAELEHARDELLGQLEAEVTWLKSKYEECHAEGSYTEMHGYGHRLDGIRFAIARLTGEGRKAGELGLQRTLSREPREVSNQESSSE